MAKKKTKTTLESLPPRERQVLDTVYRLSEAGVSEVIDAMSDPAGYSAVRTMLNILVRKGFLDYRREKTRYLYRPVLQPEEAPRSLIKNLLDTFFAGRPAAVVATLLNVAGDELSEADYREMEKMIRQAKNNGKDGAK
ncbi:MAG: BlaI/MecI/CopY family transcriptional regulator [Planctomycetaceae bacterium]|nr:BlaI/MecI/CopY family transcriptional regulator [Planctomycetaceae bacterium]